MTAAPAQHDEPVVMANPDPASMFALDAAEHELTVLRDDGLYRHLQFRRPGTSMYGFDLVTWPGYLAVVGDMGDLVFSRLSDMADFFLAGPGVNVSYWAEKVEAAGQPVKEFSERRFAEHVIDEFRMRADEEGWPLASMRNLWAAIDRWVLPYAEEGEHAARQALRDFDEVPEGGPLFLDAWEWELDDYTYRFRYLCHAIRWGCEFYRAGVKPAMPPGRPATPRVVRRPEVRPVGAGRVVAPRRAAWAVVTVTPSERFL